MGKIVIIMGRSSSGKDTLFKYFVQRYIHDNYVFEQIILHTTRPMRDSENNGVNYFFDSVEKMEELEKNGQIIEKRSYNTAGGIWHYYTCLENIDLENHNYVIMNTLEGYDKFISLFGEENIIPILVSVEKGELLTRALDREMKQANPNYMELCRRFLSDSEDFSEEKIYERTIKYICDNNNSIDQSLDQIDKILKKEINF